MTKNEEEIYKEIKEAPSVQEEELRKAWKSGQISITPEKMEKLLNAVDEHYSEWFNERLKQYNKDSGDDIEVSWEEAKRYITLRDLKEITDFTEFVKFIKGIREQEEKQKQDENAIQQQIVPQIQIQDITRAVMVMNYDVDDITGEYTQEFYIDPKNPKLGTVKLTLVNAKEEPLKLLPYERSVASALWSYYKEAGTEKGFSYQDITRFILQRKHVSKKAVSEVKEVIQNFRHIDVLIDYRKHAKAKRLQNPEECIIKRYLAPVDEVMIRHSNGYVDEGIKFIATPPLFQYADEVGEIMSTDTHYLAIPHNMTLKKEVPIRDYLKRRVNQLSRGNEKQDKILLSSVTEKCGLKSYDDMSRKEKERLREFVETVFDTWKKRRYLLPQLIKAYKPVKDGQKITGYIIFVPEEEKQKKEQ